MTGTEHKEIQEEIDIGSKEDEIAVPEEQAILPLRGVVV